jgi:hypothetical protein
MPYAPFKFADVRLRLHVTVGVAKENCWIPFPELSDSVHGVVQSSQAQEKFLFNL